MRCPECASDNPPEYRFCGMCGTPLDKPASVGSAGDNGANRRAENQASAVNATRIAEAEHPSPRSTPAPPQTLSGPSFLGLSSEPPRTNLSSSSQDFKYLLEDEQPKRTYWRFTLILLILCGLGYLGWLEYSRSGKGWVAPWSKERPQSPVQASQPQPGDQTPGTTAPPAAASSESGNSKMDTTAPSSATSANTASPAASDNSAMKETVTPDKKSNEDTTQPEKTESASAQPSTDKTADESANEADTPEPAKPSKTARTPKPKAPAAPAPTADDSLVASAEKYLYGRGVPQNCDRALISLRAAAQRSNTRAQSLLGSMYATGHCVPRDLPNAYRWFALASRDNADNMWVQRNLEMIWREMTPQERQLATARSQ